MRVSLEWLNEYVDIAGLAPETIAASLTNAGLEVEHIEHIGPQFSGVVVAKVQAV
jgi:phenylalanyl-tRNA synthetase beta chain